jgi:hypothetical protein
MKVKVKDIHGSNKQVVGYYDLQRMRAGDVFELDNEKDFSPRWMEKVDDSSKENRKKIFTERAEEQKKEQEESVI